MLDTSAALALGYRPAATCADTVAPVCDGLVGVTRGQDWRALFPALASYPFEPFDYEEDRLLAGLRGSP